HNQHSEDHDLMQGSKALLSDVDINIPQTKKTAENTFALIISNENYKQVENVPFAHNDGKVFEQYLKLAIGVPANHITHLQDASLSDIKFALNKLKDITEAYEGDSKIIVHYSGHGIPDESTSEGYLLPADGYAKDPTTALKLSDLYQTLGNMNAKALILFMDACFSGAQRSGGMIASARGVSIKVKEDKPIGNLVVMSAAQGDQTAYPYTDKEHGLMTYFLLKKLQETNGDVKLGELGDYITTQVKRTALVENGKAQVPSIYADEANSNWRNQTLR
ncbi:MAG: caspase family protein, partial [Muribaculaceae bacterium]|nr:caspase family protein [Muribaculaceae bacterium]